jgi:hypothetical protein
MQSAEKRPLGRPRQRQKDNIKLILMTVWNSMDLIHPAQANSN